MPTGWRKQSRQFRRCASASRISGSSDSGRSVRYAITSFTCAPASRSARQAIVHAVAARQKHVSDALRRAARPPAILPSEFVPRIPLANPSILARAVPSPPPDGRERGRRLRRTASGVQLHKRAAKESYRILAGEQNPVEVLRVSHRGIERGRIFWRRETHRGHAAALPRPAFQRVCELARLLRRARHHDALASEGFAAFFSLFEDFSGLSNGLSHHSQ